MAGGSRSQGFGHLEYLGIARVTQLQSSGLSVLLESGRGDKLSSSLKQYIQNLLKVNMEGPFGAEWPEEEKEKHREMSSPEALYIFVYNAPSTPDNVKTSIIGFVHYRFTIEEEIPVLYVYELQLEPAYQGKGLGKFLMQLVEQIACKKWVRLVDYKNGLLLNSMGAVVLTVQKRNASAIKFYLNKLRYNISAISPSKVYQLMGVIGEEKTYEILCKTFDHEAKAVLESCFRNSPFDCVACKRIRRSENLSCGYILFAEMKKAKYGTCNFPFVKQRSQGGTFIIELPVLGSSSCLRFIYEYVFKMEIKLASSPHLVTWCLL
ncbi:Acyl-CoA N-acyltransferase [Artemisia annua]|uniref:N-alpha-acetyltransferase 40 n=1 Tax=Artemisia annua TaxID=35608 RepID=A0A2U1N330_ARTAN|nr:Acyl-CoA N-acyltransferase [Artemisia annua]